MAAPYHLSAVLLFCAVLVMLVPYESLAQNKKNKKSLIIKVEDIKEFKKLLRTKTNLLVICLQSEKSTAKLSQVFEDVAEEMKGKATLAYINCGADKKLCKKLKFSPNDIELKHYKDGEFNKDYDRKLVVKSLVNFLLDPTGDIPWEEDPAATDVVHINSEDAFTKLLKKDKNPLLVMFYAPWCGYCKRLKPDFQSAATEVKSKFTFVGIDVDKPPTMALRMQYNITGFPTLLYFEKGKMKYKYGLDNDKASIVEWLKNPSNPKEPEQEPQWTEEKSDVVHLTDAGFDEFVQQNPSVLVMFYAPWCGHCKKMKPDYTAAAAELKEKKITGVLAAVDATKERQIAGKYEVKGFPTVKYFKNGEFAFELHERDPSVIVKFMENPQEPPPPPPPEQKWEEVESEVVHLVDESFKPFLKKKKHCLVMFYAPWCGHCKKAKPEFMAAAEKLKHDTKVAFAAVDCTIQTGVCSAHDVTGYPTFKYFNYGKNSQKYMGGRQEADFMAFMGDPANPTPSSSTPPPPPAESVEDQWKELDGSESLSLLNSENFNKIIAENAQTLVMFHAPWCGHCKRMKPDFARAAQKVKEMGLGILAAVDATQDRELATEHGVKGYPTLKFFSEQEVKDYKGGRTEKDLINYMLEALLGDEADEMSKKLSSGEKVMPWLQSRSIKQLEERNFQKFLGEKDTAMVLFYEPECMHCINAKPHFLKAAKTINPKTLGGKGKGFGVVDCSKEIELCMAEHVRKYPTFKLYVGGKFLANFDETPHYDALRVFVSNAPEAPTNLDNKRKMREDL